MINLLLVCPILGEQVTWDAIKRTTGYKAAKLDLSGHLPELAIPKIQALLETKELTSEASRFLIQLLGESQVRAGFASEALKNLNSEDSQSLQWRAHALIQLGKLREAEKTLTKIQGLDPIRQRALILTSLDQAEDALVLLKPLVKEDATARLQAIAAHLDLGELDMAEALLKENKTIDEDNSLKRFLTGRLQLARGQRLPAMGTFQTLLNPTEEDQKLSADLTDAALILLVDSTALDGNEIAAVATIIDFLEKSPSSPRLSDLFSRLITWSEFVPTDVLQKWSQPPVAQTRALLPYLQNLDAPIIPAPRAAWSLYLNGLNYLKGEDTRYGRELIARAFMVMPDELIDLRQRALIELGLHHLEEGRPGDALGLFRILSQESSLGEIRAIASSLEGAASFALQDPKQAAVAFTEANRIAKQFGNDTLIKNTEINASLSQLQAGLKTDLEKEGEISAAILQLERGLLFANRNDPRARDYLSQFISRFTKHPRLNEARLALAESSVFTSPRNPSLAREQLEKLQFKPEALDFQVRKISCLLELSCLLEGKMGFAEAEQFLLENKGHPAGAQILFRQGRAHTSNQESPLAFIVYERLLDAFPDSELADPARMLSAQAAFSVGNEAAENKAFQRYEELIINNGPLANEAAIERASLRIERGEFIVALSELEALLKKKNHPLSDYRRLLVLAAKAASSSNQGEKALNYYDQILTQENLPPSSFNRASFLKGQLLESLDRPMDALEAYNKVIYLNLDPDQTSDLEWEYHRRAALDGALPLLERLGMWEAAYETALRVSKSGGPSAERAAQRAKKIQLDKQLFDTAR
ncbi:MAG: tetratricopeptide repeat protein [Akkermansiaceae bacterium]